MISALSLKLFTLSVRGSTLLGVIPLAWDSRKQRLTHIKYPWRNHLVILGIWAAFLFMSVRYWQMTQLPDIGQMEYAVQGFQVLSVGYFAVIFTAGNRKQNTILNFGNHALGFLLDVQAKYLRKSQQKALQKIVAKSSINGHEVLAFGMCGGSLVVPLFAMAFYFTNPRSHIHMTSLLPPDFPYAKEAYLLYGVVIYISVLASWFIFQTVFTTADIIIPGLIFWTGELHVKPAKKARPKPVTKAELHSPGHVLLVYRALQLLTKELVSLSPAMLILAHTGSIVFAVLSNVAIIRFHGQISILMQLILVAPFGMGTGFLYYSHIMFGEITKRSKGVVHSWTHNYESNGESRKLMALYMRSCPVLKFKIGRFGHFEKLGALRNLGRVVAYSVRILLIFQ